MLTPFNNLPITDELSIRFLRLILPERGYLIAAIKQKNGRFRPSEFAPRPEELWTAIENADRDGYEVYHACASFREPHNNSPGTSRGERRFGRTQKNALGAKAFWLDLDAGQGKPYRDQDAAVEAVADFCRVSTLPPPIVVSSGSGLHVYWALQRMLNPETWARYAQGLKTLCMTHGLHADPTRTADISSVLRTPGTHNRKSGAVRVVECNPKFLEIEPYAIERFGILATHAGEHLPAKSSNIFPLLFDNAPKHLSRRSPQRRMIAEALQQVAAYEPTSGAPIAEQCGQVRALRDKKGCLPEPLWYAALGVLAFCEDGDELAHAWSSGFERYTARETRERADRARQLTGATTCAHFHSLNPETCEACPLWGKIKSPIVLGKRAAETAAAEAAGPPSLLAPLQLAWEYTQGGALKPKSYANTRLALIELGVRCRHDIFHDRKIVEGDVIENLGPELSDAICRALRDVVLARYRFDPGTVTMQEAAERACEENRFDPVLDYLNSLKWDGQKRLDRWLPTYLGAEDTEFYRTIGRLALVAAVRRARQPGCKFDQIIVLEGVEGTNKSTAIELMAGKENFSDQTILGLDDRTQMECLKGKWLYEIADLSGMPKSEVDAVKAFASRTSDRARAAYGRYVSEQPRRCVLFATTNNDTYLKSQTGNRRIWPVKTGRIDIDALRRDRDQLWAEAAQVEASAASLALPERLWAVARIEQEKRQEQDPWDDLLAGINGKKYPANDANDRDGYEERIASMELLSGHLRLDASRIGDREVKRLGYCMRRIGWEGPKRMRINGHLVRGYIRKCIQ